MAGAVGPVELLHNGGFEELEGAVPAAWDLFVQPPHGEGGAEATAHGGQRAVVLRNQEAYETTDPCNNWSQAILDIDAKRLIIEGYIKTEGDADAAIWVQCWKSSPLHVVRVVSSGGHLLPDLNGWKHVALQVQVPPMTEFVVVRCVLKGKGVAWFDDISVREAVEEKPAAPVPAAGEPAPELPTPTQEPPPELPPPLPPVPVPDVPAPAPPDGEYMKLLEETAELLRSYKRNNDELAEQVGNLQGEISRLKKELREQLKTPPKNTTIILDKPQKPKGTTPILVPHEPSPLEEP